MSNDDSGSERAAMATVNEWGEAFARCPAFAQLTEPQQREAGAVIESFGRYMYTHVGLMPRHWDGPAVVECCTEILPQKISAGPDFFATVAPVLSAFLAFLGESGRLPNGRELSVLAAGLGDEISAGATDRSHWGPAKSFAMAAQAAGVDLTDKAALSAFMLRYNAGLSARAASPAAAAPMSWPPTSLSKSARKSPPPAGPYEPCPCGSGRKYKFCCKGRE